MLNTTRLYFACLGAMLVLITLTMFSSMNTQAQTAGMYGPVNLYSDIYWSADGYVYASSQVTPSVPYYAHQYRATARITAPGGSQVSYTTPWYYNSATAGAQYSFEYSFEDGVFTNDGQGGGYCTIAALIFASATQQRPTTIPVWVKLGDFGAFSPSAITGATGGTRSTNISIPYSHSLNAAGKTFTVSFGVTLSGTLIVQDITGSGSGEKTVSGSPLITATYTVNEFMTERNGTIKASVLATSGTATALQPTFVGPSNSEANVN
ncbi:MAG: hypothetical protein ACREAB_07415 [Blastocatellia bacterium]